MEPPIQWLRQQLDKAQKEYAEAKKRLEAVEIVMDLAVQDVKRRSVRSQGRTLKMAEEILADKSLSSGELQTAFSKLGYVTTANSINASLNRYRGNRFGKDADGKWYLIGASQLLLIGRTG